MTTQPEDGTCPQCAAYVADLTAKVQERVGGDTCPLCAEYLELKRHAESTEAAETPLRDVSDRPEPTYREKIAAALFEQQIRKPWAMAYPHDTLSYLHDADAFLGIRDAEMAELRRQAALSDSVTTETKRLLKHRTRKLRERAERAESVTTRALIGLTEATGFARGFRLVQPNGPQLDGVAFPSGRVFVLDDPDAGLATVAVSVEDLLRGGYHGARIEWADQTPAEAALDRIRTLHRHVDWHGVSICAACSDYDPSTDSTDSAPVPYDQCATLAALAAPEN